MGKTLYSHFELQVLSIAQPKSIMETSTGLVFPIGAMSWKLRLFLNPHVAPDSGGSTSDLRV